ncbi:uncharacterized protein LOC133662266 isoform X2 [Entelurus aequoreus]|uniref:uncharacterized protein LOC133662266 isoform X2 n=1 Tax=Entelurus aequoreus TaxID=161455 RepID=UPI002B1E62B5|nr:uncharacterized protein LOC133662266 isoform X2 [Entelurus aequoreus]
MMRFMLLFSRQGKLRLQKWYTATAERDKKKMVRELMQIVLARKPKMCSFLEWRDLKIVYKRYASLYFCCAVEEQDNELITLEVIHRFVELLDKYFGSSLYSRFMSSICEEIKVIILRTLPNLSEDIVQLVVSTLKSSGVESKADLKYVEQDEIKDLLPVIQKRKLLEAFQMETTTVVLDLHPLPDDLVHQKSAGGSLSLFSSPLPCSSSSSLPGFSPLSSSSPGSAPPEIDVCHCSRCGADTDPPDQSTTDTAGLPFLWMKMGS